MLLLIIGLLASAIGSYFDATSSIGKREAMWLVRGRDGRFDVHRYIIAQSIFHAALIILAAVMRGFTESAVGIFFIIYGAAKFLISLRNRKVKAG